VSPQHPSVGLPVDHGAQAADTSRRDKEDRATALRSIRFSLPAVRQVARRLDARMAATLRSHGSTRKALKDRSGTAVIEFVLLAPVLITMILAIVEFSVTLNSYIELTNAVAAGARVLSISRPISTPYTTTKSAVTAAAANLNSSKLTLTVAVNGTACSTDTACQTALASAIGYSATVTATYPCNLALIGQPLCTLTSQSSEAVE
jgi:Flp pilus assembly protein TadG